MSSWTVGLLLCVKSWASLFVFVIYSKQEGYAENLELLCFWKSSEDRSDILLLKQGNGKIRLWGFLWNNPKNCNKMAPFSVIFTIEVTKHDGQKEQVWLHGTFKFCDCSFCKYLAIHKRVKPNCKLVWKSLQGEVEIIWGLPAPCCEFWHLKLSLVCYHYHWKN